MAACTAALATPLLAQAQQPASNNAPPPPQLERLEEGAAPEITIRKPEQERTITEKRAPGGAVKEVKVTTGKSTYYLKPNNQPGSQPGAIPGDGQSNANRAPQWKVKEFDLSPKTKEATAEQAASVPAPPIAPAKK